MGRILLEEELNGLFQLTPQKLPKFSPKPLTSMRKIL